MKKVAILGLTALFLLAGCGSKDEKSTTKSGSSKATETKKTETKKTEAEKTDTKKTETEKTDAKKLESKNKVVCSGKMEEAGIKLTMEMAATFDSSDKLDGASVAMSFDDKTIAEQYCSLYKAGLKDVDNVIECEGNTIKFSDFTAVFGDEAKGTKKADFIELMEDEGLTCK